MNHVCSVLLFPHGSFGSVARRPPNYFFRDDHLLTKERGKHLSSNEFPKSSFFQGVCVRVCVWRRKLKYQKKCPLDAVCALLRTHTVPVLAAPQTILIISFWSWSWYTDSFPLLWKPVPQRESGVIVASTPSSNNRCPFPLKFVDLFMPNALLLLEELSFQHSFLLFFVLRLVSAVTLIPIVDFNELTHHILEAIFVHKSHTTQHSGQPMQFKQSQQTQVSFF